MVRIAGVANQLVTRPLGQAKTRPTVPLPLRSGALPVKTYAALSIPKEPMAELDLDIALLGTEVYNFDLDIDLDEA